MRLVLALMVVWALPALSAPEVLKVKKSRLIEVVDRVTWALSEESVKLLELAKLSKDDIYIHINSPGGAVVPGVAFIQSIKRIQTQGIVVHCFVTNFAASMAFLIYTECDKRYALGSSLLLWHAVRTTLSYPVHTQSSLDLLSERLRSWHEYLMVPLPKRLGIEPKFFWEHSEKETMHIASKLHVSYPFFKIVDDYVIGD